MSKLDIEQQEFFWRNGYLLVPDAVSPKLLDQLKSTFNSWVEESYRHCANWGDSKDGRPRFDLEPGHTSTSPRLRRVNAPTEISEAYFNAMAKSSMTDYVASLIGPNIKFHHSKINSKQPGSKTTVKWHQDFPFTPHSNNSVVTALLMVDEVTRNNGPLRVVPGSHLGPIYGLWHNNVFTGAIDDKIVHECTSKETICIGSAGSVCLMHTCLLHGSATNKSSSPRTLFISVYSAVDAVPLSPNPVPNCHEGIIVRGKKTGRVRSIAFDMNLPQLPTTTSFFDQQAKHNTNDSS